jgi:glucose/arabinose dehydrogenase
MRTLNWMVSATLLLSLSAVAQQPADSQTTSQPATTMSAPAATPDQTPSAQPMMQAAPANAQPAPPQAGPQPTTMDQVVDRFVMREKGLIKMLQTRTPVIETYLQNLTLDPAL